MKRRFVCVDCRKEGTAKRVGPLPERCAACKDDHHRVKSFGSMREIRRSAAYREDERRKVKERMRKIRAARHKAGITGNGTPYKSKVWRRKAAALSDLFGGP